MRQGLSQMFTADERCSDLPHVCHCAKYEQNPGGEWLHPCSWPPLQLACMAYRLLGNIFWLQTDRRTDITTKLHAASYVLTGGGPKNRRLQKLTGEKVFVSCECTENEWQMVMNEMMSWCVWETRSEWQGPTSSSNRCSFCFTFWTPHQMKYSWLDSIMAKCCMQSVIGN